METEEFLKYETQEHKMRPRQQLPARPHLHINGISKLDHIEATIGEMHLECGFIQAVRAPCGWRGATAALWSVHTTWM